MREPITITATLPAWITSSRGVDSVLGFVRSGQQEAAVSALYFGQRGAPRLAFEALASDAFGALIEHEDLRQEGERMEIEPARHEPAVDDQVRNAEAM